jgi:hypothetical protein
MELKLIGDPADVDIVRISANLEEQTFDCHCSTTEVEDENTNEGIGWFEDSDGCSDS